jgi:DNA-binding transcriptional MerR regulator
LERSLVESLLMKFRVDELASRSGVSVDTVRFYQTKGLLPAPEREGRTAWYSDDHLERLERIRSLKDKGFTLAAIRRFVDGELGRADEALVEALVSAAPDSAEGESLMTRDELSQQTGVPPSLLAAIEREGLMTPRSVDDEPLYSRDDVAAVRAGLALLEAGLPLSELLALARGHDQAMRETADRAVDLFLRFVRDPIRAEAPDDGEAADRLVSAFRTMLGSTTDLVAHHFKRVLLAAAEARLSDEDLDLRVEGTAR